MTTKSIMGRCWKFSGHCEVWRVDSIITFREAPPEMLCRPRKSKENRRAAVLEARCWQDICGIISRRWRELRRTMLKRWTMVYGWVRGQEHYCLDAGGGGVGMGKTDKQRKKLSREWKSWRGQRAGSESVREEVLIQGTVLVSDNNIVSLLLQNMEKCHWRETCSIQHPCCFLFFFFTMSLFFRCH